MKPKVCTAALTPFVLALLLGLTRPAYAQSASPGDSTAAIGEFMQKIQQAYTNPAYLQFQVKYRYANERQPDKFLDSLFGEVEMDKGRSRTVLDGTETVLTGRYAIQIVPDSRVIYLSSAKPVAVQNPLPMLDSLVAHIQGMTAVVAHVGGLDILTIRFPPDKPYTKVEMRIDSKTGYFRQADYWLHTTGLVGEEMIERPGHPARYQSQGRVQVLFTDYQHGRFDDRIFNEENFFTRAAGHFDPAGRYKDYHIYLASSNL
jgi:hypothetical protein